MMYRISLVVVFTALLVGCQEDKPSPDTSAVETTQTTFNEAGAPTVRIEVPEMMCESCVEQVTKALSSQEGVEDVKVSLEDKLATVAIDKEKFNADDAITTLVDYQFFKSKVVDDQGESEETEKEDE